MPPRFVYWTIIAGGLPTAFRAAEREDLLPTFHRIKERQPDAQLKYFARGKLWESQDEAKRDAEERRRAQTRPATGRGRDWRPGGEHRDPRQDFKDAKADRNLKARKRRFERRTEGGPARPFGANRPPGPGGSARPAKPYDSARPAKPYGSARPAKPYGSARPAKPYGSARPPKPYRSARPAKPRGPRPPTKRSR